MVYCLLIPPCTTLQIRSNLPPCLPVSYSYFACFRWIGYIFHRETTSLLNLELLQNYGASMWLGHNKAEEGTEAAVASQVRESLISGVFEQQRF